jgi:hypothetical protein
MNALLEPLGRQVNKSDKHEVRESILFWYEFFKPKGKLTNAPVPGGPEAAKLASALLEFLELRPVVPSKYPPPLAEPSQAGRHKTLLPKGQIERVNGATPQIAQPPPLACPVSTPVIIQQPPTPQPFDSEPEPKHTPTPALDIVLARMIAADRSHKTSTTTTSPTSPPACSLPPTAVQTRAPKRLTLQLLPKEEEIARQITQAGFNPLLQLTFASKKPISYIIQHMMKKWTVDVDGTQVRSPRCNEMMSRAIW